MSRNRTSRVGASRRSPVPAPAVLAALLAAGGAGDPDTAAPPSASDGGAALVHESPSDPACEGADNLIENPFFTGAQGLHPWRGAQHAGERSFDVTVEDGVVTVSRIGSEPWYTLTQTLDVADRAGHRLRFSADLRLDLDSEGWGHGLSPGGGLMVTVWAGTGLPVGGERISYRGAFEQEPSLGRTDWFRAETMIPIPENATRLRVGFLHRANGSMGLRDPRLLDCGSG